MKASEQQKESARQTLVAGMVFASVCLVLLGSSLMTGETVVILGCFALLCFTIVISVVEYWNYKNGQKKVEQAEAKEEAERQR